MSGMRNLAVAVSAALVFALVAPAFAQPFADVPTNHWAYDAIAELAAKGLIEGYPDGTFKGDRAMTRYEMAMVVARLLARIESIQIPAPTPPEVTKADLDAIQRLVNEFRAELAALGVRVTAIEEELNAIKARLDNVRVTGGFRFREDVQQSGAGTQQVFGVGPSIGAGAAQFIMNTLRPGTFSGATSLFGINGNPRTTQVGSGAFAYQNRPRYEFKLGFDGSVAPNIHFIAALESSGTYQIFNSSNYGAGFGNGSFGSIDSAFLDWQNAWGVPLDIRLGRFGTDSPCGGGCYPIVFGPFGLIMNDSGDTWEDSTGDSGVNVADGLWLRFHEPAWADLQVQAIAIRVSGVFPDQGGNNSSPANPLGPGSYIFGENLYGLDVNVQVIPSLRIGADYVGNTITPNSNTPGPFGFGNLAQWHLYGPGGGSVNPGNTGVPSTNSYHCVTSPTLTGILCPALGNGYGFYVDWKILSALTADGEWAAWNDSVFNTTDNGYQVNFKLDLGSLTGIGHALTFQAGYLNYGQNFYTPYGAAEADINENDWFYPGNANGVTLGASIKPLSWLTVYANYFGGNSASTGQNIYDYEGGVVYNFAPNANITFKVRQSAIANVTQFTLYRAQIDYSF